MNETDRTFKIGLFGLATNEQNTLGSIFKLATSRPRQYTVVSPQERATADIILVDIDDANALNEWRSFDVHNKIPVVNVTKTVPAEVAGKTYLRRPLTLKRVLETLDKVTIEAHKYAPEIVVGGEEIRNMEEIRNLITEPSSPSGVKVLVVDDSLPVRKSMEIQLGLYGMEIDFAETGEEALEYIQKDTVYDIIFLDLMLPGIDGYKVCKEIKSHKLSKCWWLC